MKLKTVLPVWGIILAALFSGCGLSASNENISGTANEPVLCNNEKAAALSAYREILVSAPAIEGEHEELSDASFNYEQNAAKFGSHYDLFSLYDINQDGIPELITGSTVNFRWMPVSVFTCADGAAILLKDPADPNAHGTFEQMSTANGAYITYICEENHIHNVWRGTTPLGEAAEENRAFSLEGTVLTPVDCSVGENEHTVYFYDIAQANTEENIAAMNPS